MKLIFITYDIDNLEKTANQISLKKKLRFQIGYRIFLLINYNSKLGSIHFLFNKFIHAKKPSE